MKCPACGHKWKLPGPQAGGRAKVKKGFADPRVQAKAQATRRRKAKAKGSPNARPHAPERSDGSVQADVGEQP